MSITHVVIFGPICGRWYVSPILNDGVKGGATGFDSIGAAQAHIRSAFPGVEVLRSGVHALPQDLMRFRKLAG